MKRYLPPILQFEHVPERLRSPDPEPWRRQGQRCQAALYQPDGLYQRCRALASSANRHFCRNCHGDKVPARRTAPAGVVVHKIDAAQLPLGYALIEEGFLVNTSPIPTIERAQALQVAKGIGQIVALFPLGLPTAQEQLAVLAQAVG